MEPLMDPERWEQVDKLLQLVSERPPMERKAFLQVVCGDDGALREEVESLLASQQQAGSFLEDSPIEMVTDALMDDKHMPDHPNAAFEPGVMIGHYRLAGRIGEGGMGEIYRTRDTRLQRDVALKILPQAMAYDLQRMARFEREAQVLASLNHPSIAAIHGLEESNGIRELVMELAEGETLAERIVDASFVYPHGRPQGLLLKESLAIAKQIAEVLEYAHERCIIHRDLKPANVKVTLEGTAKVLDFGLAKALSPPIQSGVLAPNNSPSLSATVTQAAMLLGTAAYMRPE